MKNVPETEKIKKNFEKDMARPVSESESKR